MGIPVTPGFTLSTEMFKTYQTAPEHTLQAAMKLAQGGMKWLEDEIGHKPLVSVRSGAPVSMPGMMDTILNVGLTTMNLDHWKTRIGERAALDSYRRLIQMLRSIAYGLDHGKFEHSGTAHAAGVDIDSDLSASDLQGVVGSCKKLWQAALQKNSG